MQFEITGRHIDISPAMRKHIESMLAKIQESFKNITTIHITQYIEKHEKVCEATLHTSLGKDIHADARHEDMYVAVEQLGEKLTRQLQRHKEKTETH